MKKYRVKIIHEYEIEADSEEQATNEALERTYGEARDCYLEVDEIEG